MGEVDSAPIVVPGVTSEVGGFVGYLAGIVIIWKRLSIVGIIQFITLSQTGLLSLRIDQLVFAEVVVNSFHRLCAFVCRA